MNEVVKEFGMSGTAARDYAHPQADAILSETQNVLAEIPEGQRLLALAREKSYVFKVIVGKQPDWHITPPATLVLVCPITTKAVNLEEMALSLGLGIREMEQPSVGIARPAVETAGNNLPHLTFKHLLDINLEMYKIVGEFEDCGKHLKFLDVLQRLGHSKLYRAYRTGSSDEEMAELIRKTLKK